MKTILSCMLILIIYSNAFGQTNTFSGFYDFSNNYLPKPCEIKKFKIVAICVKSGDDYYDSTFYDINTGFIKYSISYGKEKVGGDSFFITIERINYYYRGDKLDSVVSITNKDQFDTIINDENIIKEITNYDSLRRVISRYTKRISDSGKTNAIIDSIKYLYIEKDSAIIHISQYALLSCLDHFDSTFCNYIDTSFNFYNNKNQLVKEYHSGNFFTTYNYHRNRIVEFEHIPGRGTNKTISLYYRGRIIHKSSKDFRCKGSTNYFYRNGLISKIINKGRYNYYSKFKTKTKFTIIKEKNSNCR